MIFRLKRTIGTSILASAILATVAGGYQQCFSVAHAATYYVATTGNNSNPGTKDSPFQTIAYAVSTMVAGDTTYVRGGMYSESGVRFLRSGTASSPIRLLSYPNESPILSCTAQSLEANSILIMNGGGYSSAIGWIEIEGLEVRNCWDGIKVYNLHDSTIRRNWIHDTLNQGILGIGGTRILIDRNIINHNGPFSTRPNSILEHGIYMHGSVITITNNLIYGNMAFGIQQNGSSSSAYCSTKHAGPEFAGAKDWIIANNTLAYQNTRAGIVVWGSRCLNARIENNIFYENAAALPNSAPQGIDFVSTSCTGVRIRNNHFYASGSGGVAALGSKAIEGVHYMQSGNIVNVSDPAFVNAPAELPASPNFSLTARSPAIDKGLPLAEARTAFDGTIRPQGRAHDIGAYEYSAGNDAQSTSRPVKLEAH